MKKHIFLTTLLFGYPVFGWSSLPSPQESYVKARQDGNNLVIDSPYGSKIFFGQLGFDSIPDFELNIPLDSLKTLSSHSSGEPGAVHNFKTEVDAILLEANSHYLQADFKQALAAINQALESSPKNVRALMMKGSVLHVMGQKESALEAWGKALALDPANKEISSVLEKYK